MNFRVDKIKIEDRTLNERNRKSEQNSNVKLPKYIFFYTQLIHYVYVHLVFIQCATNGTENGNSIKSIKQSLKLITYIWKTQNPILVNKLRMCVCTHTPHTLTTISVPILICMQSVYCVSYCSPNGHNLFHLFQCNKIAEKLISYADFTKIQHFYPVNKLQIYKSDSKLPKPSSLCTHPFSKK